MFVYAPRTDSLKKIKESKIKCMYFCTEKNNYNGYENVVEGTDIPPSCLLGC